MGKEEPKGRAEVGASNDVERNQEEGNRRNVPSM
jgi:hypothetical protein